MPKLKVYLDTSIISYLDQSDAPEKMQDTIAVWEILKKKQCDIFISNIVLNEINACDENKLATLMGFLDQIEYTSIEVTNETISLAEKIIDLGILKRKSFEDCQHIAAAIISNCDMIISWNFKHIVNVNTIRGVKILTTMEGYKDLMIYPPSVLVEENTNE